MAVGGGRRARARARRRPQEDRECRAVHPHRPAVRDRQGDRRPRRHRWWSVMDGRAGTPEGNRGCVPASRAAARPDAGRGGAAVGDRGARRARLPALGVRARHRRRRAVGRVAAQGVAAGHRGSGPRRPHVRCCHPHPRGGGRAGGGVAAGRVPARGVRPRARRGLRAAPPAAGVRGRGRQPRRRPRSPDGADRRGRTSAGHPYAGVAHGRGAGRVHPTGGRARDRECCPGSHRRAAPPRPPRPRRARGVAADGPRGQAGAAARRPHPALGPRRGRRRPCRTPRPRLRRSRGQRPGPG